MRERKRSNDHRITAAGGNGPGRPGDAIEQIRHSGEELLAAGDEVIERALTGNSAGFLQANRQSSGQ